LKKILIIRFSSIGDIVLTTPLIRCLKQQLPDSEIHYLTKEKFSQVIMTNPYIDHVHILKNDFDEMIRSLRSIGFDYIVDLHKNLRSARVKRALKKPSGTFDKLNIEKWLLVNLRINRLPDKHIVDRYFEAVSSLGIINDHKGLDYFIPEEDSIQYADLPPTHRDGFIGLVIGGMHYTKMLPLEKLIELCKLIEKPLVLLGGKEEREKAELLQGQCGDKVYNACGLYNINQSASLIKLSSKIVTNDTGLMHIAAAFNKEIFSVWGNTVPGFGMYPYLPEGEGASSIIEVKGLSCRPCSKIGYSKCPKGHFKCMLDIDMKQLAVMVNA
jgi:ADP-heptose:LPS heptosyltransferase